MDLKVRFFKFQTIVPLIIYQVDSNTQAAMNSQMSTDEKYLEKLNIWTFNNGDFGAAFPVDIVKSNVNTSKYQRSNVTENMDLKSFETLNDISPQELQFSIDSTPQVIAPIMFNLSDYQGEGNSSSSILISNLTYLFMQDTISLTYSLENTYSLFSPPGLKIINQAH